MPSSAAPRILIIRLSAIGDCVMASPLAQTLREHFPGAHIAWAVQDKSRAVVEGNPYIDEIIQWHGGLSDVFRVAKLVRKRKFDIVLEVQGLLKSTLLMALSGAPKRLVSPAFGRLARLFATQIVNHPPGWIYPPDRYLYWAKALGAPVPAQATLTVPTGEADRAAADQFLREHNAENARLVGINPGCSALNRKWSADHFARTAKLLANDYPGAKFVLLGGPQDREDTASIALALPAEQTLDAAGRLSLRASAALIERCELMLTNDTGPMHIAVAVETPVVAVCGPISAARRLPLHYPANRNIGVQANRGCLPPNRPQCGKGRECPCLAAIKPADVAAAARQILDAD